MPDERELNVVKKSMAYDLIKAVERSEKDTFTKDDIKALIDAYIAGLKR